MIRSRIMGAAAAVAIAGGAFVALAPQSAGADVDLLACSGIASLAKLNPTLKSGDAKYFKAGTSGTTGTCFVDAGITANQSTQDVKYLLDNQSNGNAALTMLSNKGSFTGSATCNNTDTSLLNDYPATYPLQGKVTWKYNELDALLKNLSTQMYVRTTRDIADPNVANIYVSGIAIKGVGVGGDISATLQFFPNLASPKNLNIIDCAVVTATQNAVLAELDLTQSDGVDAGTAADLIGH